MSEQTAAPAAIEPEATEPDAAPPPMPELPLTPPMPSTSPRPPRRILRAVARWTVAVLVLGGVGAGTAYEITAMERTDVPGLATESDGRWDYPQLSLPALPTGKPRPFNEDNTAEIHYADLRALLLPAPDGATVDKKLAGGWVSTRQFVSEYEEENRNDIAATLRDGGLRHVAARGWTMPDGTSSRVYLLRFNSTAFAQTFLDDRYIGGSAGDPLAGAPDPDLDESWAGDGKVAGTRSYVFAEAKPFGAAQVRQSYLAAGDTVALIVQSRKGSGGTPRVPFHQTVILQNQMLG
ncbi:hypothetical protein ACWF9B_07650 [Streptomyces sp. NPDC055089]